MASPRQGSDNMGDGSPNFSGLAQFFGGLFGNSGAPYEDAMKQYEDYENRAQGVQNPFLNMGTSAIPQFQQWLKGMQDPSGFINALMNKYQQSPYAKFQQQQNVRTFQNLGSASGLTGSTPLTQFAQQNAENISSQDMQNWLSRVLGINTQYGAGLNREIAGGQNAADSLTNMFTTVGNEMGEAAYGREAGRNADRSNIWGGLFDIAKNGLFG